MTNARCDQADDWRLLTWVRDVGLPWWAAHGWHGKSCGFVERFSASGDPFDDPQRCRVVARQLYVFASAGKFGLLPQAPHLVEAGVSHLKAFQKADGTYGYSLAPKQVLDGSPFCLYEQAFVIFCLAKAYAFDPRLYAGALPTALSLLETLHDGWKHPRFGFEEANPRAIPLLSNPHMHLFEASLAWLDVEDVIHEPWYRLANELCQLCIKHFIDPDTGALRELYDEDWQALDGARGQIIEPGHQFEWAWLLFRWATKTGRSEPQHIARQLIDIGENLGVDPNRNVAFNSLRPDLSVFDAAAKLWPQTERLKAWCALGNAVQDPVSRNGVRLKVREAHDGLMQYIENAPQGLWREVLEADGTWSTDPTRASSLYHIVSSCEALLEFSNSHPLTAIEHAGALTHARD